MRLRLLAVLAALAAAPLALAATFNHDPASAIGPYAWGTTTFPNATCGSVLEPGGAFVEVGKRQSPVDIVAPVAARLPGLGFLYAPTPFEVENNGHAVEVPYAPGSMLRVGQDLYELRQFHFHAPSEHAVNGRLAALEMHLVHQNALGDLAVVGVRFDVGLPANALLDEILFAAPLAPGEASVEGRTILVTELLPATRGYYTYSGSLTTPPCSEGVRWIVLDARVGVSQAALDRMHEIVRSFPGYEGYPDNNRPVRPLNGRAVFHAER